MKTRLAMCSMLLAIGCSEQPAPTNAGNQQQNASNDQAENDHGKRNPLGELMAFGNKFAVVQFGEIQAGAEGAFELEFASAEQRPGTVRGWIGSKDAMGSRKSRWGIEGIANMHGHVDVPDPIPADSSLWIELVNGGDTVTLSIAYK